MLKKLRILTVTQHALMLAYRAEIYLWVLAHVMPFLMMGVWVTASRSGAGGAGGGGGMAFALTPVDYARYFVCVFIVRQFSTVWMIHEFEWHIVEGRLSYFLLRPMNPLWNYVTAHLGEQLARFPFFVVVLAFFFILYPQARWMPSASAILLGFFTIYVAFALRFALQYCFAMLTFWFERASAIEQLSFLPYVFLSGLLAPLADFPEPARRIAELTPFPYVLSFPAQILMGQITASSPQLYQGFAVIAAWFAGLCLVGQFLWRRGLRRYSGQGA